MDDKDPLNLDELIRQAQEVKRRWRLPKPADREHKTIKPWQQVMGERLFRGTGWG